MSLAIPMDELGGSGARPTATDSRKRRRRIRRGQQCPLQGKLLLDDRAKGYTGLISTDLAADLLGHVESGSVHHIAIAPWQPPSQMLLEDGSWTVLPVKVTETALPHSTIRFPTSSLALQSFSCIFQGELRTKGGVEILIVDVQPVTLDTVFVRVDGDALRKHEDVQKRFRGGFQPQGNGSIGKSKGKASERPQSTPQSLEDELRAAMRTAMSDPIILHKGDLFPIPLPAHPITHVPFPPVEVVICEPVDQGIVSGDTKIVIDVDSKGKHSIRQAVRNQKSVPYSDDAVTDSSEDTSAEAFYSAAEGKGAERVRDGHGPAAESAAETETEDETDDDDDNAISLSQPILPPQASGVLSSMTAATPRPLGALGALGARTNGIASPGSVFSGYTATTARGIAAGKSFDVKPLIKKVPDSVLHPSPPGDDDDESRVYVDVKMLVRIGCFSGDWIKLTVDLKQDGQQSIFPAGAFGEEEPDEMTRVVKVYGIPDVAAAEALQRRKAAPMRRGSIGSVLAFARPSPSAYMSPILYFNLGKPSSVTLAPLSAQAGESRVVRSKIPSSAAPPVARELTLLRVMTPFATERATSGGIFANLKKHFARRRRLLQTGDLVAVAVDASSSRILADDLSKEGADQDLEELLIATSENNTSSASIEVAWFKVGPIAKQSTDESPSNIDPSIWAEVTSIESDITRLSLNGSEQTTVPVPQDVPWDYYFGTRSRPRQSSTQTSGVSEYISTASRPDAPALQRRIRDLMAVASSPHSAKLNFPPIVVLLHSTQRGIGKRTLIANAVSELGLHFFPLDAYDVASEGGGGGDVKTEATLRHRVERALQCGSMYTVPLIQHVEALTAERTAAAIKELLAELKILFMTTTELDNVADSLRALVTHELEVSAPSEPEREAILSSIVQNNALKLAPEVELKSIAVKTAALVAADLVDVLERASVVRELRLEQLVKAVPSTGKPQLLVRDLLVSGGSFSRCLTKADLDVAVEAARKNFADAIGAPKIPNVTWDDVGGLSHVKDAVMETIQLPLERPELFAKGMKKRSGILFYGPPGTGKTLLAKAIATEFSLNFFSVKGPELLNMYIGESEANVRRVFQRARDARPCVVFFDELDSVAPKRGNQGDSGGVMDRIVSQLLAELDGMSGGGGEDGASGSTDVFVIGATNRPDLLDQALLRPGRFDKMLYLGIADTHDKQLTILEALTRKFTLDPALDLRTVANRLPFLYTGADMYALCSDAMLKAITRKADAVDARIKALPDGPVSTAYFFDHLATREDVEVVVTERDFVDAQRELVGSVSAKELEHYQRVRAQFEAPDSAGGKKGGQQNDPNGLEEQQDQQQRPGVANLLSPPSAAAAKGKGKGKAKEVTNAQKANRIQGTAAADSDEDDGFVTSNDFDSPQALPHQASNGFRDAAEDDDEELYG